MMNCPRDPYSLVAIRMPSRAGRERERPCRWPVRRAAAASGAAVAKGPLFDRRSREGAQSGDQRHGSSLAEQRAVFVRGAPRLGTTSPVHES
jgi:hypothetical protein